MQTPYILNSIYMTDNGFFLKKAILQKVEMHYFAINCYLFIYLMFMYFLWLWLYGFVALKCTLLSHWHHWNISLLWITLKMYKCLKSNFKLIKCRISGFFICIYLFIVFNKLDELCLKPTHKSNYYALYIKEAVTNVTCILTIVTVEAINTAYKKVHVNVRYEY